MAGAFLMLFFGSSLFSYSIRLFLYFSLVRSIKIPILHKLQFIIRLETKYHTLRGTDDSYINTPKPPARLLGRPLRTASHLLRLRLRLVFAGDSMSPSRNLPLCLHCRSAIAGFLWRTASHLLKLRLRLAFVGDSMSQRYYLFPTRAALPLDHPDILGN